jgi:hypothetical protein
MRSPVLWSSPRAARPAAARPPRPNLSQVIWHRVKEVPPQEFAVTLATSPCQSTSWMMTPLGSLT